MLPVPAPLVAGLIAARMPRTGGRQAGGPLAQARGQRVSGVEPVLWPCDTGDCGDRGDMLLLRKSTRGGWALPLVIEGRGGWTWTTPASWCAPRPAVMRLPGVVSWTGSAAWYGRSPGRTG